MTVGLIATDMDGTFLDGQGSFDKERFSIILNQLNQKNIPIPVVLNFSRLSAESFH